MNQTISTCQFHSMFLKQDGQLNSVFYTKIDGIVVQVAAGDSYSLALTKDGRIFVWNVVLLVNELDNESRLEIKNGDFIAVAAGDSHYLALTRDGKIFGWGNNDFGQTDCPQGNNFIAVAAGQNHSVALTRDGKIVGWGWNDYGQIPVNEKGSFVAIAAGGYHSLALTKDGRIVGWGPINPCMFNCSKISPFKELTSSIDTFVAISAGEEYSIALTRDGRIVGCGHNDFGQINCPKGENFIAISAAAEHAIALTSDGQIVGWGWTNFDSREKIALPYDFLGRLNRNVKVLCSIPKYIKMEILEDYTGWTFGNLYYL